VLLKFHDLQTLCLQGWGRGLWFRNQNLWLSLEAGDAFFFFLFLFLPFLLLCRMKNPFFDRSGMRYKAVGLTFHSILGSPRSGSIDQRMKEGNSRLTHTLFLLLLQRKRKQENAPLSPDFRELLGTVMIRFTGYGKRVRSLGLTGPLLCRWSLFPLQGRSFLWKWEVASFILSRMHQLCKEYPLYSRQILVLISK